jgi:beta-lactamase superfamily II metal-dependent hydrolase
LTIIASNWPFFHLGPWMHFPADAYDEWPDSLWLRIDYDVITGAAGAYYYELFADEEPVNISIRSLHTLIGPSVALPPPVVTEPSIPHSQTFDLFAFHVGQGMCALLRGSTGGILLDAGAGTPIRRSDYRKKLISNDLTARVAGLSLQAIISHPDSDHWRLLEWDAALLVATQVIFTPSGTSSLGWRSPTMIPRMVSLAGTTILSVSGNTLLKAHRSRPAVSDRNGECLVVETITGHGGAEHCLFPGDYVYDRMAVDRVSDIVALSSATLDAVMVPHHGDAASASVSARPRTFNQTIAFFSAGTHAGYGHPTPTSIHAHSLAGFATVAHPTYGNIVCRASPYFVIHRRVHPAVRPRRSA